MKTQFSRRIRAASVAVVGMVLGLLCQVSAVAQQTADLNIEADGYRAHIMPTVKATAEQTGGAPSGGPLDYHGGPVMTTVTTYAIYWVPPALQNGGPTGLSPHYQDIVNSFLTLYPGHGLANNNTQYSAGSMGVYSFIQNTGHFGGSYVDTSAYPASACSDPKTPGNCLSDSQIQDEIKKVIGLTGWKHGLDHMFLVFTSSGEGSCYGSYCAYTDYCGYHSYFFKGPKPVIYSNQPYADPNICQVMGTPTPNSDAPGDAAANVASHELTEAITDPMIDAWYDGSGQEIGDKCAWNYGPNTWDWGTANQSWFVSDFIGGPAGFFELQLEYDNHAGGCVQVGP